MEVIWHGFLKAVELVFVLDAEVWSITWRSLQISGTATLISLLVGIPLGIGLALMKFPGRNIILIGSMHPIFIRCVFTCMATS